LQFDNMRPDPCPVEVTFAAFVPQGLTVKPLQMPLPKELRDEGHAEDYLAFRFDNQALWNEGRRTGVLLLTLKVDGEVKEFRLPMVHTLDGFQRLRNPPSSPKAQST